MPGQRVASAICAAAIVLAVSREAAADPQGTAGLTIGAAARGYGKELFYEPAFHAGLRGDVLFGRDGVGDVGAGPYFEVLTHAFDEIQLGSGLSVLLPAIDSLPFVASVGAYGRYAALTGLEPGIAGSLFFGSRSYDFSDGYVLAIGLLAQGRVGLGESHESSFLLAIQLDVALAGLPFLYAADAASGGSRDTDRVPR